MLFKLVVIKLCSFTVIAVGELNIRKNNVSSSDIDLRGVFDMGTIIV